MHTLIQNIRYGRWANLALLDAASALDQHAFTKILGGSFPSIHQALVHILWAESLWLQRWRGGSFAGALDPDAFPTSESLRLAFEAVHANQLNWLSGLPPSAAEQLVTYVNFQGQPWTYALRNMVQHLVVHSAFHRGQVASMLRRLGAVPPHTDFLVFIDVLVENRS